MFIFSLRSLRNCTWNPKIDLSLLCLCVCWLVVFLFSLRTFDATGTGDLTQHLGSFNCMCVCVFFFAEGSCLSSFRWYCARRAKDLENAMSQPTQIHSHLLQRARSSRALASHIRCGQY